MSDTTVAQAQPQAASPSVEFARVLKLAERRETVVVQVATWVGLGIIEGRLLPGQDLNSVELSHRFGCSRTPVREALMLLEQEGLVEIQARRRPRVAAFTPERVREIYHVRQHLMALVGQLAVERVSGEDLADLRRRLSEMEDDVNADDVDSYFWKNVALQERLTEIAGNRTLKGILDSLALRVLTLRHASLAQPGHIRSSLADQRRIFEALEQRDGEMTAMLLSRAAIAALDALETSGWAERQRPLKNRRTRRDRDSAPSAD